MNRPPSFRSRFSRIRSILTLAAAGAAIAVGVLPAACASKTEAKADKICTAGAYVFCRCADREEGTKLCNDTGTGFGRCEPCETDTNPEIPPDETKPIAGPDGGGGDAGGGGAECGNGKVEPGEDCDDKNEVEDDGCNKNCKIGGVGAGTACPGIEVHVWGGAHAPTMTGTTKGSAYRQSIPTCTGQIGNSTTGAAATDRVFKVVAHKTGLLKVQTSDVNYDSFLYASLACPLDGNVQQIACVNAVNGSGGELLSLPVDAGKTYYVIVDGAGIDPTLKEGNFRVTFSIP